MVLLLLMELKELILSQIHLFKESICFGIYGKSTSKEIFWEEFRRKLSKNIIWGRIKETFSPKYHKEELPRFAGGSLRGHRKLSVDMKISVSRKVFSVENFHVCLISFHFYL